MNEARLLTSLDSLRKRGEKCVLLYSGGLDSSYFLWWAKTAGLEVLPLYVGVGGDEPKVREVAAAMGYDAMVLDETRPFAEEFVAEGIQADCMLNNIFPISSSLSRPLMARCAGEVARSVGASVIVHTAGAHQNSSARFNRSVVALYPDLIVASPFVTDGTTREAKLAQLTSAGVAVGHSIYSIDANIWARVVENGVLESVRNPVPEDVFAWTTAPSAVHAEPTVLSVGFDSGLPVSLDGARVSLPELITTLNRVLGAYGIGRFNGVEQTYVGLKNHELREAPAAYGLLLARRHLEQLVLTTDELRSRLFASREWIDIAVAGGWYSDLRAALGAFLWRLARPVTGVVRLQVQPGYCFVDSIDAANSLAYDRGDGLLYWDRSNLHQELLGAATVEIVARRHPA